MTVLRIYSRIDEANMDAAYLGGMGIESTVIDERGYGGNLLATTSAAIRLEVADELAEPARDLLRGQLKESSPPPESALVPTWHDGRPLFFRAIMVFNILWDLFCITNPGALAPPPPDAVAGHLESLSLSRHLDQLAEVSAWPLVLASLMASFLCYFYARLGRMLYTGVLVWSALCMLAAPTSLYGPAASFVAVVHGNLSVIALALMFWSPLSARFEPYAHSS